MPAPRVLSTLCPKRLRRSDCINISNKSQPIVTLPRGKSRLFYDVVPDNQCRRHRFPPDTRGFLYYYTPPKAPPFVGDIRFRLANDLDSFRDSEDLLSLKKIVPWTISLYALAHQATFANLREQLLVDGLISQTTLDKWADRKPGHRMLYYLRQPFFLRFEAIHVALYTVTRDQIGICVLRNPLAESRGSHSVMPYGGSALVQFEPYEDRVALRILKIVEPVQDLLKDYDGYVERPMEGALVRRLNKFDAPMVVTRNLKLAQMKDALMLPVNFEDLP